MRQLCPLADAFQLHLGATCQFTKKVLHLVRATLARCDVVCNACFRSSGRETLKAADLPEDLVVRVGRVCSQRDICDSKWLPSTSHAYLQHILYGGGLCRKSQGPMEVTTSWRDIFDCDGGKF